MKTTAQCNLFHWTLRELCLAILFFIILSAIYCFMAFGMSHWGMGRIMPTTLLTFLSFLLMFLMALVQKNRLVPHIVLICFWSLVVVLDLCYSQARLTDLIHYASVSFLVTAGFVLLVQLFFITVRKENLHGEK